MSSNWYKKLRIHWLALALVLVLAIGLPLTVGANGTTVTVGTAELEAGETADIPVVVNFVETTGMGAYVLNVTFNPDVIMVLDVLGGDPPFDTVTATTINNTAGWVRFDGVQMVQIPGPIGTFTIAYLSVQAIGNPGDSTDLTLTINELVEAEEGDPVEATPINGQVTIMTVSVGGDAYPVNKLAILAPWIALAAAIAGVSLSALRRRKAQS
jgi:hypothetical protein